MNNVTYEGDIEDVGLIKLPPPSFGWQVYASAKTADGTQIKRLWVEVGAANYKVTRRYLVEMETWTVYEGSNWQRAAGFYNGLS